MGGGIKISTNNIVDLWDKQVDISSSSIAVKYNNRLFTYKQIDERVNKLSEILVSMGVKNETIVGVLLESSDYYIVSILAILKAGGAFLPIDISYPKERIEFIIKDSKINILISEEIYANNIAFNGEILDICNEKKYETSRTNNVKFIKSNNLAYIIYTSGTTGFPKGVMIEHKGVVNLVNWFNANYNVKKNRNILQITNISFDVSIEEIFGTLLNGGTLFIPPKVIKLHKNHFRDYINENKINIVQTVPIMLKELILNNEKLVSLNVIICGGEPLDEHLKNSVLLKGYNLFNHYGPTEITVDATSCKCRLEEKVSIGRPIDNMYCYVINNENKQVDIGQVGEIYIYGVGIARGYLNNPDLTDKKFVNNIFYNEQKMYKTGDLVKYNDKMQLIYMGRIDDQIKIRGNRVELKEIEQQLMNYPEVKEAVALVVKAQNEEKKIAVFWTGNATTEEILEHLLKYLPSYMIPNYFKNIKEFMYTSNGKLNREYLKKYINFENLLDEQKEECDCENNRIMKIISEAIEKPIKLLSDNINCNLQCFGIDSIAFVQAIVALEDEFDIEFEDEFLDYRKFGNIKELIQYIEKKIE